MLPRANRRSSHPRSRRLLECRPGRSSTGQRITRPNFEAELPLCSHAAPRLSIGSCEPSRLATDDAAESQSGTTRSARAVSRPAAGSPRSSHPRFRTLATGPPMTPPDFKAELHAQHRTRAVPDNGVGMGPQPAKSAGDRPHVPRLLPQTPLRAGRNTSDLRKHLSE